MADLDGYAIFAAVVEAESFTGASRALGLSKSAVSKAVGRLEDRLGARLLNRTTRNLSLTEAGAAFHARCLRILAEVEDAECEAAQLTAAPRGTLRVNASVTFGTLHLAPVIPDFLARHPGIRADISLADRYVDLVEEGVDVAIRIGRLRDSGLRARWLAPLRQIVCASPGYWDAHGRPERPRHLAGHNCLTYAYLSTGDTWHFDGADGAETVRVSGTLHSNNGDMLRSAALSGLGVVLEPSFILWKDLAAGTLEAVLTDWTVPAGGIFAVYPPGRYMPAKLRVFIDFLAGRFGETPYWDAALPPLGPPGEDQGAEP
ncbi:MAG: LysR family transcriptional regulator [Alphaproteobacteria bacterium]|nr:LysR family transcriptional regulator [Alphaproteobacteria bacterium]